MLRIARGVFRRARSFVTPGPERFLRNVRGVIHVGANAGQERDLYQQHGLHVIWIEPIPEVFEQLEANLRGYPRQRAFQYLVTDADDKEYAFHISNNDGKSSSILALKLHKDIWPDVTFTKSLALRSITLPSLLRKEGIDIGNYNALIMDTQGSELLVLEGAAPILPRLRFVKTEVSDFESYEGCCQLDEMNRFLGQHGFRERYRYPFARRAEGGIYYDVTYERVGSRT
jgi:FkbM family methyltransferase